MAQKKDSDALTVKCDPPLLDPFWGHVYCEVSQTARHSRCQEREMVDLFRLLDTDGEGELPGCSSWWFLPVLLSKDRFFARLVGKFYAIGGNDREVVVLFSKRLMFVEFFCRLSCLSTID